jgi:hypothetical protein
LRNRKSPAEQKRIERWFLEDARRLSAIIPNGVIDDRENPDFSLTGPSGPIGIEVTEQCRRDNLGPFSPAAEGDFHEQIVMAAEKFYRESCARPVRVIVFFKNDSSGVRRPRDVGRTLCDFVASHGESYGNYTKPDVPEGFDVIGISPPDGQPWLCGSSANLGPLKYEELASTIREKESKLATYRNNLPERPIWLLVYISITTSRTVALPYDAPSWHFESDFDRIILYNCPEKEVLNIGVTTAIEA